MTMDLPAHAQERLKGLRIADGSDTSYQPSLMFHTIGSLNLEFTPGPRIGR